MNERKLYLKNYYEKNLKKYLAIYLANIHANGVGNFASYWFDEEEGKAMHKFCYRRGYLKDGSITDRGIKFLDMLEKRRLSKLQFYFNIVLTIATCLMAVTAIFSLI